MKRAKNKQLRKYILWGALTVLVLFLAVMPLLAVQEEEADGPQASILSGTVQHGNVEVSVRGGGFLAASSTETVTLPSGVKITGFLVKNGDTVTEGTPLASVDRVTLMEAIVQVQDTLTHLQKEITSAKDATTSAYINATAGGRIKKVYAREGERVQDVMLRDGALAVLSLDGLMAVTIERNMPLSTGTTVCVRLSDDREVDGRVESNLNNKIVITIDDEGYPIGETVTVTTEEGKRVGSGALYAHNTWLATGFTGTVSTVYAQEEKTVSAGSNLFILTDTELTAEMEQLADKHQEYQQLLQDMIIMYENGAILAPCDGLVSGIDTESTHLLSGESIQWEPQLLRNAQPEGEKGWKIVLLSNMEEDTSGEEPSELWPGLCTRDESCTAKFHLRGCPMRHRQEEEETTTSYTGYAACVISVEADSGSIWVMQNPEAVTVTDPDNAQLDTALLTSVTSVTGTAYADGTAVAVGDYLLITEDGSFVKLTLSASEGDGTEGGTGEEGTTEEKPGAEGMEGAASGRGEAGGRDSAAAEPVFEPYPLEGSLLMTLTARQTMTLSIPLDEQDIAKVHEGQTASVTVSALRGQTFAGEITEVSNHGTSSGGSSKFTVEITLPVAENMLPGMSATVSIPLYTKMDVLTIPVAALVENGTRTQVYTALDAETGEPASPVAVTIGVSDGETAEILSGLESGDSFYYSYYDTLELSTDVERPSGFGR